MRPERLPCGPLTPKSAESLYRQLEELSKQSWFTATYPVILDLTWAGWVISLDVGNGASTPEFPWYLDSNGQLTTDYTILIKAGDTTFTKGIIVVPTSTTVVPVIIKPPSGTSVDALKITKPGNAAVDVFKATATSNTATWTVKDPQASGAYNQKTVTNTETTDKYYITSQTDPAITTTATPTAVYQYYTVPGVTNSPTLNTAITTTQAQTTLASLGPNPSTYNLITSNMNLTQTMIPPGTTNPANIITLTDTTETNTLYLIGTTTPWLTQTSNTTTGITTYPTSSNASVPPVGLLSLPTLTVTGPPTWTPAANTYPIVPSTSGKLYWWNGSTWDAYAPDPLTTKGDLWGFNTTTDARVPVGTDGYFLSSNSSQTTGLEWVAVSGASPGGSNTQFQFNNSGAFGGTAEFTYSSGSITYNSSSGTWLFTGTGTVNLDMSTVSVGNGSGNLGFYGSAGILQPTVSGLLASATTVAHLVATLQSLFAALNDIAGMNLFVDSTT